MADGGGGDAKMIITIFAFTAIFAMLLGSASSLFIASQQFSSVDPTISQHFQANELGQINFWYNSTDGRAYSITEYTEAHEARVGWWPSWEPSTMPMGASNHQIYSAAGETGRKVNTVLVRDGYVYGADAARLEGPGWDGFLVTEQWGIWDNEYATVSFSEIVDNYREDQGRSGVPLVLQTGLTLYFLFDQENMTSTDLLSVLESQHGYSITVGTTLVDTIRTDAWSVIGGLLTFNPVLTRIMIIDAVLSVVLWTGVAYVVVAMIGRLLP